MIDPVPASPERQGDAGELRAAGQAFEALILQQMLGGILPENMPAGSLATQALARSLAEASPFGIAVLLETRR